MSRILLKILKKNVDYLQIRATKVLCVISSSLKINFHNGKNIIVIKIGMCASHQNKNLQNRTIEVLLISP